MKNNKDIEQEQIPEIIGIKDLLDMLGTTNNSISTIADMLKKTIEIQLNQQKQIDEIINFIQNNNK